MGPSVKQLEEAVAREPPAPANAVRAFGTWAVVLAVAVSGAAALLLILRLFFSDQSLFKDLVRDHVRAIVGIPLASASAFCILLFFEARSGNVQFTGLGFTFKGGAGPAVIWVFAFLAFTGAIRLLW
jgi:hypothetical protein